VPNFAGRHPSFSRVGNHAILDPQVSGTRSPGGSCCPLVIPMKDIYIADLANFDEGKLFDGFFLVLAKQQRTTKSNKAYLSLILGDKTGQLEGRVWEPSDPRIAKDFERGDIVKARGSASRFDDRLQMKIDQLRVALPSEVDKADLLPSTTYDIADLWSQLLGFVDSFTNPDLKLLLTTMLADPVIAQAYREAPPPSSSITPGWAACSSTSLACSPSPTASRPIIRSSTATC